MRRANQLRPLIFGLPIVIFAVAFAAFPAAAWNFPGFGSGAEATVPQPSPPRAPAGAANASYRPHWTDGQVVQQAYAEEASARVGGVVPASHTGPSRGGTLFGGNGGNLFGSSSAVPFSSSNGRPSANGRAASAGKKPPTWHGYSLRMPTKMFARDSEEARPAMPRQTGMNPRVATASGSPQYRPNQPAAAYRTNSSPSGRIAANMGSAARVAAPPGTPQDGRQPSFPQAANPSRPNIAAPSSPAASLPPQTTAPRGASIGRQGSVPTSFVQPSVAQRTPSLASRSAAAVEPKTPADRMILQVHDLAATADTEDEFTRIIETCRRARVSQASPPLAAYANQLAAWALNRRGQIRAEAGRIEEALPDFDDAIRANPKLWRALHNRGVLQAQAGNYEQAFDDFNLTLQCNPQFAKAYSNRAALFVVAGDLNAALEDYGKAIELDPNLAIAHRGRGRVCHLLGRLDESLDHFDAAVQLDPQDAYAISSRADLLTDIGRYREAAVGYEQAIGIDPQFANAYRGSAWLLATCPDNSLRNAALAIDRAHLAIQLEGRQDAVSYDTLAAAQASAGDYSAAVESLHRAIELAPDSERAVYQDRLRFYQRARPYRIAPVREVTQASYEASAAPGADGVGY